MAKNPTTRLIGLAATIAFALMIAIALTFTLASHAAAPSHPAGHTIPANQSNISQAIGKLVHYSPKTLACTRTAGTCSIVIKNTTGTPQSVTAKGKTLFTLTGKQGQTISYKVAGTYTYSLVSNPKTTLTVTVS